MLDSAGPSSSRKRTNSGKSLVSSSSPVHVSSSPEGTPLPSSPSVPLAPPHLKKYVENYNRIRKHIYFISKAVL